MTRACNCAPGIGRTAPQSVATWREARIGEEIMVGTTYSITWHNGETHIFTSTERDFVVRTTGYRIKPDDAADQISETLAAGRAIYDVLADAGITPEAAHEAASAALDAAAEARRTA